MPGSYPRIEWLHSSRRPRREVDGKAFFADLSTEGQEEEQFPVMYADLSEAAHYFVAGLPSRSATIRRASSDFRYPFIE
jgi:hypothetical protein